MSKERLTITLESELLQKVDKSIDGVSIRSRSHAIEHFLRKSILPQTTKVLILAGGQGVKFSPLKQELPKSLLPINDKPLLSYTLESLRDQGFRQIVISVGHLGSQIKEYFGDGSQLGLTIEYLEQDKTNKGTAQPVSEAKKYFADQPFLLIYGDVLTHLDFREIVEYHVSSSCIATMALTSVEKPSEWGVANLEGTRVTKFVERPKKKTRSHMINAGVYVLSPEVFKHIPAKASRLEQDLLPALAEMEKLCAYPFDADWHDVSNKKVYDQVINKWK